MEDCAGWASRGGCGTKHHARWLKKERGYLAQITEEAQPATWGLAPGVCLCFHSEPGKMGACPFRLAASVPREIKEPARVELVSSTPVAVGSAHLDCVT